MGQPNRQSLFASIQQGHSAFSRNSNRNATNAGSMMNNFGCSCGGGYDCQRTLVILRIVAVTLASASAITIERFRPSKTGSPLVFGVLPWAPRNYHVNNSRGNYLCNCWPWNSAEGQGEFFLADFTVNFASESACLVPVEHPEQARAVAQTNCNV